MVQQVRPELIHGNAVGCRINAANQHSRNVETVARKVTPETFIALDDQRFIPRLLGQHIKTRPLFRILRGKLNEAAAHDAHGNRIVEVKPSRIRRTNDRPLHAGFRKDCHLRFRRNLQRVQQGAQISVLALKLELNLVVLNVADQICNRIP